MMRKSIISLTMITSLFAMSCGGGEEKKEAGDELDADLKKMCECFEAGKNDSRKFIECSEENGKIRAKYKDDNDALVKYDAELAKCM